MSASDPGKLDPTSLESGSHDARNGAAGSEWTHRRSMGQKNPRTVDLRSGMQHVVGERLARFLQERYDAVAPRLGPAHQNLGATPMNISKFERSQLFVAQPGGCKQEQHRAIPHARRRGRLDLIDRASDILPRQAWRQVRQPIARRPRNETGKVFAIEIGPPQKTQERASMGGGRSSCVGIESTATTNAGSKRAHAHPSSRQDLDPGRGHRTRRGSGVRSPEVPRKSWIPGHAPGAGDRERQRAMDRGDPAVCDMRSKTDLVPADGHGRSPSVQKSAA